MSLLVILFLFLVLCLAEARFTATGNARNVRVIRWIWLTISTGFAAYYGVALLHGARDGLTVLMFAVWVLLAYRDFRRLSS